MLTDRYRGRSPMGSIKRFWQADLAKQLQQRASVRSTASDSHLVSLSNSSFLFRDSWQLQHISAVIIQKYSPFWHTVLTTRYTTPYAMCYCDSPSANSCHFLSSVDCLFPQPNGPNLWYFHELQLVLSKCVSWLILQPIQAVCLIWQSENLVKVHHVVMVWEQRAGGDSL